MLNSGDEVNNCVLRNLKICMAGMSDKDTQIFLYEDSFFTSYGRQFQSDS
jgi:hypothetical protein